MKKYLLVIVVMVSCLFGEVVFKQKDVGSNIPVVKLKTQLKGSHKGEILNFDFYKNLKLMSVGKDNYVKIWDIKEQELIKSLYFNELRKALFSKDGRKLYILTSSNFYVYDSRSYKEIFHITSSNSYTLKDFIVSKDDKKVVIMNKCDYGYIEVYNLENGKLLGKISELHYPDYLSLSKNSKYFAVMFTYNPSVSVYNFKTFSFISKLPKIKSMKSIEFIDNKNILILSNSSNIYVYNFKTSELSYSYKSKLYLSSILNAHNKSYYLLAEKSKKPNIELVNLEKGKILKKAFIDSGIVTFKGLKLSDDNSLLAVGYTNGNFKLYLTNEFLSNLGIEKLNDSVVNSKKVEEVKPKIVYKDRVVYKEKVVYKDRIIKEKVTSPNPKLVLECSNTTGFTPLKVTCAILVSDDNGIDSYYINLAGKEMMKKGTPPTKISKIFNNEGEYKILVAVKNKFGKLATKSVVIKAKEESFSDFKKAYR